MIGQILVQLIVATIICCFIAAGTARLGLSRIVWFFAVLFGGAFSLGLITALPDRKLERRRVVDLETLRRELADVVPPAASELAVRGETIGDQLTRLG